MGDFTFFIIFIFLVTWEELITLAMIYWLGLNYLYVRQCAWVLKFSQQNFKTTNQWSGIKRRKRLAPL